MPVACLSCHGGQYDSQAGAVEGASFLPKNPSAPAVLAEALNIQCGG